MIASDRFRFGFFLCLLMGALMAGCQGSAKPEVRPDTIYLDYQAIGDEELGEIVVRLQFRSGGPEGEAILLGDSSRVLVDGKQLGADSSKMNGIYYEAGFPLQEFSGLHEIIFEHASGLQRRDSFYFPFFSLREELAASVSRAKDLELPLTQVEDNEALHIMLTDTSFYGRGVDRMDSIREAKVLLTRQDFSRLNNGPVHAVFYRELERALAGPGKWEGRLYLSYNISREFILTD